MDIQQKEILPINFICFRTETTVQQLANLLPVAKDLFREASRLDLTITGPIHWHYFGFNGDSAASFTLEIALPVAEVVKDYDGSFHFKRTDTFKCIALVHNGPWQQLPASYEKLMHHAGHSGLHPAGINREVYINSDFANPAANITEVQIGIN